MSSLRCRTPVKRGAHLAPCGDCHLCRERESGSELASALLEVAAGGFALRLDQTFRQEPTLADGRKAIAEWLHILQVRYGKSSLRYFAAAEYGTKGSRLHFHILLIFSEEHASAVTGKAIRSEARQRFGVNTARVLKRPGDKMTADKRSRIVAYALKQAVGYALKGAKSSAPPFAKNPDGSLKRDARGRPVRERVLRFTRSQNWGRHAAKTILSEEWIAPIVQEFRQAGVEPIFKAYRDADSNRYWLPSDRNPLPPPRGSEAGIERISVFAADLDDEEKSLIAGNRVVDGYLSGERFSFDPATASMAVRRHGRQSSDDAPQVSAPAATPRSNRYADRLFASLGRSESNEETSDDGDADDLSLPDDHMRQGPVRTGPPPRLPPLSYAQIDRRQKDERYRFRYRDPGQFPALVSRLRVDLEKNPKLTPGVFASYMHADNTSVWRAFEIVRLSPKLRKPPSGNILPTSEGAAGDGDSTPPPPQAHGNKTHGT